MTTYKLEIKREQNGTIFALATHPSIGRFGAYDRNKELAIRTVKGMIEKHTKQVCELTEEEQ